MFRTIRKKSFILLLTFCMIFGLLPIAAFGTELSVSVWDGSTVATAYENGDGTEANPYEIATAEQFAYFAKQISEGSGASAHYILTNDLDMTAANWEPIGCTWDEYGNGYYFHGTLNGNGHCITYSLDVPEDMTLQTAYRNCGIGLFGICEATFTNLRVDGTITMSKQDNASYYGGICGLYAGNMENCTSDVDITITEAAHVNSSEIGGLVGEIQGANLKNCAFSGIIKHLGNGNVSIGGISGYIRSGSIVASKNEGDLSGSGDFSSVGGIVGVGWSTGTNVMLIEDCYNTGKTSNIGKADYVGGIAGDMMMEGASSVQFIRCYSSGNTDGAAICPGLTTYGEDASYKVDNCYYLTGTDENGIQAKDLHEIFTKLSEATEENTWILDANGIPRLSWEFTVNPIPQAVFTATGENEGTLSGVDASMKYSTDGGNTWKDIADTTIELTGVTAANDVKVYQPGDRLDTLDSEIQTIDITQADKPAVNGVDCTAKDQNNGQLTGVDNTMEYKLSTASDWIGITGTSVTNLASGVYDVRIKANGTVLASAATAVTIGVTESVSPAPPIVITYYDITADQPEHGTITLGRDRIYRYGDVDVTLTPEEGYEVKDLLINGASVGAVSSYTIEDVIEDIHVTAVFGETEAAKKARIIKGVQETDIKLTYKMNEIGKGWIKIRWTKEKGYAVDYYEVFRSAKNKSNFGKEAYFTKNTPQLSSWYKNTKEIKKGTRYYYKVRGVREIDGKLYYTKWSNTTWRTGR